MLEESNLRQHAACTEVDARATARAQPGSLTTNVGSESQSVETVPLMKLRPNKILRKDACTVKFVQLFWEVIQRQRRSGHLHKKINMAEQAKP